jgi:RimJ/RimL family protein N-acetyltransferase
MKRLPTNSDAQGSPWRDQIVELRDGTRALIRPIGPWDRERLNEGFMSASAKSTFLRFLTPMPRLSNSQLEYLTAVDHIRHEALIALDPETGQSFGTARYVRRDDHPETAEFAVGVGDRWMRIGLGTALLSRLVLRACEVGVIRFTGTIHSDNTAVRRLLDKVIGTYEAKAVGMGAVEVAVDLPAEGACHQTSEASNPGRDLNERSFSISRSDSFL